ncbi:MAG: hypothetical protein ACKOYM_00030 [Actinomycetes bacterium]
MHFDVTPSDSAAAASVPVERISLADVVGVDEVAPPHQGVLTVRVARNGGATFDAALPAAFVQALVGALHTAPAAAPTLPAVMPVVPPLAPPVTAPVTTVAAAPAPPIAAPVAPSVTAPATVLTMQPVRSRRRVLVAVAIAAVLVGLLGTSISFWNQANNQADRANVAEANLANTRNTLAATQRELTSANTKIADTEAKVKELTTRVSELGNEKAKVQDERNAAQELSRLGAQAASAMVDCRDRLVDIIGYIVDEYYATASAALDVATPVCQSANSAIRAFQAAAG